ncbi:MAG: hypothetical protein LC687_04740 [Actinobacteria bacterium]|nr:hypothetical protein [Actinomycetota bacterium]MCA1807141.1 hypothetical protein [Actinomycetota bacterium]
MSDTLVKRDRTQESYMLDAEYIRLIKDESVPKEESDKYRYELYTKYFPLIKKMARKFNLSKEDTEDYLSESYFVVLRVIEYTDVSKIDDNYSFGYFLRFNLLNAGIKNVKKSQRQTAKLGNKVSWDALVEAGHTPTELSISEEEAYADSEVYDNKAQVGTILERLPGSVVNDRDKRIMKKSLDGYSCQELSRMFNLSHMRVFKIRRHVADVLRTEVQEFAH